MVFPAAGDLPVFKPRRKKKKRRRVCSSIFLLLLLLLSLAIVGVVRFRPDFVPAQ